MLAAFFETFVFVFASFLILELALRMFVVSNEPTAEELLAQDIEDAICLVRLEQIGNVFYFYNSQDDNFVGQATSVEEMAELSERLQKHIVVIDGDASAIDNLKLLTKDIKVEI